MRKLYLFLFISILTIVLAACNNNESTEKETANDESKSVIDAIKERGVLRVAVFSDKPPFGYVNEKGENQGYDIVLAKRIAKDLLGDESKIEYVITEPQARVDLLKSDKVDIVLANFTVTKERAEQVDFVLPYMKVAIGVVSPKSAPISSVEELKGKKLIVPKGTTAETFFMKNHPDVELVKYDQINEAFEALKDGRGDALAQDNALLFSWANENPDFTVALTTLGELDYIAPAVKKGNTELLDWLNAEMEKLYEENFFTNAYEETLKPAFGDTIRAEEVVVETKPNNFLNFN
ncbi:transporter substrate-binding domain-containing protein [Ureibacillus thermophilus]|uniref:Transporter substrate-binding domain-containing protein n=1 Tax=Ureibacillus thermophilus TaxID=367743 RepID=A0A4P6UT89_9BACL|nr:cysteine ABC transporter substrate-binding protein [Ureibacillus thermophilus]QBK25098.1 transporter substrate-binding domain-containing protein [Ureibacillus thermophilus]